MKQNVNISRFRFVLVLLVVFVHMGGRGIIGTSIPDDYVLYQAVNNLFTATLTMVAVPGLFMVSGYLFFANDRDLSAKRYADKMKRRVFSLLIPFVIWNLVKFAVAALIAFRGGGMAGVTEMMAENGGWRIMWDGALPIHTPILMVTWYMRDLMVMCLLCPIIYVLVKKLHLTLFVALLLCSHLGVWPTEHVCTAHHLSFFVLGATLAIHDIKAECRGKRNVALLALTILCVAADAIVESDLLHDAAILTMAAALYNNIARFSFISERATTSAMFLYLAHGLYYLSGITAVVNKVLPFEGDLWAVVRYFTIYIATVVSLVLLYTVLKKHLPRLMALLTGGR